MYYDYVSSWVVIVRSVTQSTVTIKNIYFTDQIGLIGDSPDLLVAGSLMCVAIPETKKNLFMYFRERDESVLVSTMMRLGLCQQRDSDAARTSD